MKQLFIFIAFYLSCLISSAQIADPSKKAAAESSSEMNARLVIQPTNESYWLEYFNLTKSKQSRKKGRELPDSLQKTLSKIAEECKNYIPNSYTSNFINYENLGKTKEGLVFLDKAYAINPNPTLYDDKLAQAVIQNDKASISNFAGKLENANIFNAQVMQYNKNVLQSVSQNGFLITYGFEDTYPLLILQEKKSFRKDVKIICMDWLVNEEYYNKIKSELGLKSTNYVSEMKFLVDLLKAKPSNLYLALTLPPHLISSLEAKLFCTGLAMKLSINGFNNLDVLRANWTQKFELSEILKAEKINTNYLIPLLILKKAEPNVRSSDYLNQMNGIIKAQNLKVTSESLLRE